MREQLHRLRPLTIWMLALAVAVIPLLAVFGRSAGVDEDLTVVSGVLGACGTAYCVGDSVTDFGPPSYLESTEARADLDGNGIVESLAEELDGHIGQSVVLEVEDGNRDVDVDVFNGLEWGAHADLAPPPGDDGSDAADQPPPPPPTTGSNQGVGDEAPQDVSPLVGTFTPCGDRYCVDGTSLHFGPWWYVQSTPSENDFDGNGTLGTLAEELGGLVDQQVTLDVKPNVGKADVYSLNGVAWRPAAGGPPPWAGGPLRRDGPAGSGPPDGAGPPEEAGPPDGAGPPGG